jgi:threonine dehydrogenase-like Zn-dependent dehydrogenase
VTDLDEEGVVRFGAMVLTGPRELQWTELEMPGEVGPDEAVLRVEGVGLCGSDCEQFAGGLAEVGFHEFPVVPGHEPVGTVAAIGERASALWKVGVGDRVAVEPFVPCAVCPACTSGEYHLCTSRFLYGFTGTAVGAGAWGGYAEYMRLGPNSLVHRIPEHVSLPDALLFNPLGAGFEWAYRAAGVRIGDTVLVLGPGQRGLACVVAAREAGAEQIVVTGTSADEHKLAIAQKLGATATIVVDREDTRTRFAELTGGPFADRVIDTAPTAQRPVLDALELARPGGTVVLAGLKGSAPMEGLVVDRIVLKDLTVRGVLGVRSWSYEQAIRVIASGRYDFSAMHTHEVPLRAVEHGIALLAGTAGEPAVHVTVRP